MPRLPEDKRMRYHPLNKKQLAFVRYNGDMEEAAQAAGYVRKSAVQSLQGAWRCEP